MNENVDNITMKNHLHVKNLFVILEPPKAPRGKKNLDLWNVL
jgi:hypothetical protein